jgi:hypothetical protein
LRSIGARTIWKLAATTISPSSFCFSFEIAVSTSPVRTVELFQPGSSTVEDTTYLGRLFSLSARSPLRLGQRAAIHS